MENPVTLDALLAAHADMIHAEIDAGSNTASRWRKREVFENLKEKYEKQLRKH